MKLTKGIKFEDDPEYKKIQDVRVELKADRERSNTDKSMDDLLFGSGAVRRKPKTAQTPVQPAPPKPAPVKPTLPVVQEKKPAPKQETVQKQEQPKRQVPKPKEVPNTRVYEPPVPPKVVQQPRTDGTGRQGYNRPTYIRKLKKIAQNFNYDSINQTYHTYFDVVRPFECERSRVQLLQKLSTGNSFQDKQFPTTFISVGRKYKKQNILWQRAYQFCNRPAFGKYVEPNDIQIGRLSCPSFLSVLSCLAERQQNIKRLIQSQQYNNNGFYFVRLNINSVWRYIAVDDFLPSIDGDNVGLLSFRDTQSQISLSLIEKAYAKAYGGYDVFEKQCKPQHYLRDLTGSRVAKYSPNSSDLLDNLGFSLQQNWTVVAVPNKKIEELGLSGNFNLSVIGLTSRGLQLRNSWGSIVERPKVNLSKQGVFQLSLQQASKYFDYILVAETDDKYHTTTVQSKHQAGFYSSYTFKIKSPVQAIISASQWDQRLFPSGTSYKYSPFRVILDKKTQSGSEYVGGAYTHAQRNSDTIVNLTPGEYTIFCIGSWKGQSYDYSITLYGNHAVKFDKNYSQTFPNLISKSLQQVNLNSGKRSAKGHVDEYILYHEPTNLMLLSNLNISDKPYDYTQDLSKINFNSLNLLNGPNSDDHFIAKLEEELTTIKSDHNSDRRWSIHLQPKQAYTWVISTNENYDANNFKNWGFK